MSTTRSGEGHVLNAKITSWIRGLPGVPGHTLRFALRVLLRFFGEKNGLILAGAVSYNTLLSVIPLFALIAVFFSTFVDEALLLSTIQVELSLIAPGQSESLVRALQGFLQQKELIGVVGLLVLLFFSSIAFRVLENALNVIFDQPEEPVKRSVWVSVLMPYLFICVMGVAITALTAFTAALDAIPRAAYEVPWLGWQLSMDTATSVALYLSGVVGLTLLFAAIYRVLPLPEISFRRALVGGLTASVLWEIVRHIMVWYFTSISLVNMIYGSLATVVIVLLSMEVASVILLLGAQVIAELDRADRAGVAWYEKPSTAQKLEPPRAKSPKEKAKREPGRKRVRTHRKLRDEQDPL
ncbi:YihY/virulence factor BrkB family protein [Lujinxingia vulgaris]|uniref:YihY/virulence factor BrkB family protein n=1 Tax=Lujinxingia vulgaris TaxID=2600176 RepID=A0A5C6XD16_9DELT|nr:YihY/virulence factor BrkB family protein [Lujinxingia vulgaris]